MDDLRFQSRGGFRRTIIIGLSMIILAGCNRAWRRVDGVGMDQQPRVGRLMPRLRGHGRTFQNQDSDAPRLASQPRDPASTQSVPAMSPPPASVSEPNVELPGDRTP